MSRPSIEEIQAVIADAGSIRKAAPHFDRDESTVRRWLGASQEDIPEAAKSPMKILAIDIETRPNLAYVWDLWNQNISLAALRESVSMICFVAKWLHLPESGPLFYSEFHHGRGRMIQVAWSLLDTADVIVHYNGVKFDTPHLNREFVQAGLPPASPFKQVDLLKVVKKRFKFPSNKLAYVAPALGLEDKVSHEGYGLWLKCMAGDADAWDRMREYNLQDVILLEQLYEKLLPWIDNHPSHAAMMGKDVCPTCASEDLRPDGLAYLRTGQYPRFRCGNCGVFSRASKRTAATQISLVAA